MPPKGYRPPTAMDVRDDLRSARARERALVDVTDAAKILAIPMKPRPGDRENLVKAAESLNAYLAELER
jgi:hypothetical protein